MTREEAIYRLKNTAWLGTDKDREETEQAVDMAIEALSADTVSREQYDYVCEEYNRLVHKAVCIKLCDENCEYEKGKTCYHAREHSAIEALKQEPVKHGKWIESKERSKHWYCSVCGCIHTDPETGKWRETFDYRYPFCPNCGAKMYKE